MVKICTREIGKNPYLSNCTLISSCTLIKASLISGFYCILLLLQQEIITLNDADLKRDVMLMVGLQDLIEQHQVIITKHLVITVGILYAYGHKIIILLITLNIRGFLDTMLKSYDV